MTAEHGSDISLPDMGSAYASQVARSARDTADEHRPWIAGAGRDLIWIILPSLWLAGMYGAVRRVESWWPEHWQPVEWQRVLLAAVAMVAVGYYLPSFVRVSGHRAAVGRFRTRLLVAPLLLLGLSVACALLHFDGLLVVVALWGVWHAMTQTYGLMRIYDSKVQSFAVATIRLDFLLALSWFGAGLLYSPQRMEQLLTSLYACGLPLVSPTALPALQLIWGGLTVLATTAFVINYVAQRAQNQRPSILKLAVMVSSFGFWWFTMVTIPDLLSGVLLFGAFHAIQDLALVRVSLRRSVASGESTGRFAAALGGRTALSGLALLALALLYGVPFYWAGVTPWTWPSEPSTDVVRWVLYALVSASAMLHFYVEGFAWRVRDDWVRASLGVPAMQSGSARGARLLERIPHAVKWGLLLLPLGALAGSQWRRGPTVEGVEANLVQLIPQSWSTHARYGAWLLEQGRPNDAMNELAEALRIRPDATSALIDAGRAARTVERIDEAISQFENAVAADPQSVAATSELGKTLFSAGRTTEGLLHLQRAVDLTPDDAMVHFNLGLAMAQSGRPEDAKAALASLSRAIALDESMAAAYNARGNVHSQLSRWDEAIEDFSRAIELDPQLFKAYRNRARLWERRKESDKALADWSALIAVNPTSTHYVERGDLYQRLGQYDKARDDYLAGMRQSSRDVTPAVQLAKLYLDKSYYDPPLAVEYAQTACQLTNWRDFRALALLAAAYSAAGNPDQAVRWQDQALRMVSPDVPEYIQADLRKQAEQYQAEKGEAPASGAANDRPPATPPDAGAADQATPAPAGG